MADEYIDNASLTRTTQTEIIMYIKYFPTIELGYIRYACSFPVNIINFR